jgi:hypothetical protein
MNWIFIGMIAGSLVISTHDTKEACLGRQAVLKEQKVDGQCVQNGSRTVGTTLNSITLCTITDASGKCLW